jgi:hypothetical protein
MLSQLSSLNFHALYVQHPFYVIFNRHLRTPFGPLMVSILKHYMHFSRWRHYHLAARATLKTDLA